MDTNIIVDKQCGYNFIVAAENLINYCRKNKIFLNKTDLLIIFSNNWEFIRSEKMKVPKKCIAINITENLSEQHVINTLRYVTDICYLKSDVSDIAVRIIKSYTRNKRG